VEAAEADKVIDAPPSPIYQPTVSTNELRLPVGQFKDNRADWTLYAFTVQNDLTQASVADLLKLSTCAAKYRTPYLMERFIEASVNLETRTVDCCRNRCLAFTHKRVQQNACDACGAPRYKGDGKSAKQMTYWSLTSLLAHLLGDAVIGKSMQENMAAARKAAERGADGVHDYYNAKTFRFPLDKGLLGGVCVMLNCGTDGFQILGQNGFEGWTIVMTLLSMSPDQRTRNKYQLLMAVTPGPKRPVDLESFLHQTAEELNELANGIPGLMVAGSTTPQVLTSAVLNFSTNQPGGDKLTQYKGINSYIYNRLRLFKGVYFSARNHVYYPPKDPASGNTLFEIEDCIGGQKCIATPRTATSIAASAVVVEDARTAGRSIAYQTSLEQKTGIKGYSLFFGPSPAMSEA